MALPTLVKTWQLAVNQTVAPLGSATLTAGRVFRTIKNLMKAPGSNPWTVVGSSNGVAAGLDTVDRWSADGDMVNAVATSPHSWIVLKQTGIGANFQVMMSWDSTNLYQCSIVISPSAGFTGGSTTANPTATDAVTLLTLGQLFRSSNTQQQIHFFQSTDGAVTRVIICSGGGLTGLLMLEKPANTPTGWTLPFIGFAAGNDTLNVIGTYNTLISSVSPIIKSRAAANFSGFLTGEGNTSSLLANLTDVGSVANDFDASWPLFPIGFGSVQASTRGRHGHLYDLWWRPNGRAQADTFPNNASARQFAVLGDFVVPWLGDATTPLVT